MTDASAPLFEVRALHLWRGEHHLLRGVSFQLHAGELLQVTGPNGVGKSTLLRAACRLLPVEDGEVFWNGKPIERHSDEFNAQIAYLAHSNALKPDLTAAENLRYELALRRTVKPSEVLDALELLGIERCAALPVRALSAGQRRRLAFARIVLSRATLWILDEPSTNLDASGIALLENLMSSHVEQGGAILTAAHHELLRGHRRTRGLELRP